ncbi:hypothetical protein VP01_111g6 [Puccinia sorghi]|uniref:Uncharacterized protein n=1 Tax=Puccinia sorghi TaxID=27349 RepID=A0A0L6VSF0_9BASI|nr:hypothetical protein VP01_111g6 [Puccinia sorghi]
MKNKFGCVLILKTLRNEPSITTVAWLLMASAFMHATSQSAKHSPNLPHFRKRNYCCVISSCFSRGHRNNSLLPTNKDLNWIGFRILIKHAPTFIERPGLEENGFKSYIKFIEASLINKTFKRFESSPLETIQLHRCSNWKIFLSQLLLVFWYSQLDHVFSSQLDKSRVQLLIQFTQPQYSSPGIPVSASASTVGPLCSIGSPVLTFFCQMFAKIIPAYANVSIDSTNLLEIHFPDFSSFFFEMAPKIIFFLHFVNWSCIQKSPNQRISSLATSCATIPSRCHKEYKGFFIFFMELATQAPEMTPWCKLKFCYARRNRCPTRETFPLLSADGNIRWARSKLQPKIRVEGEFLDYAQKVRQRSQFDRYVDVDLNHTGGRLHMQSNKSQRFLKFRTYTIRAIQHEFEGQKEG